MPLSTRILWLKIGAFVVWTFGVATWLAIVWPPALAFANGFFDVAIWPVLDGAQSLEGVETNMLLAIVAGFSVAIGTFVWVLATSVMPRDPALARRTIAIAMGGWLAVDSLGSWFGGAGGNVLLNLGFGALFLVPALWPDGRGARERGERERGERERGERPGAPTLPVAR